MSPSKPDHRETADQPALELVHEADFYVSVGDVVSGKYRVEQVLGVGGMAFVLSAKHVELEERFALKFLDPAFVDDEAIIERFTREAKAACRIRSEHVARVYDVGMHEGSPFIVMEHLEGRDLATILAENGPLPIEDAVEYAMQTCEALAAAHRLGIVHRDIKPENLFLVEHDGLPMIKVLDFGISKTVLAGDGPISTLTGDLSLGTPCYMSPEQIRSTATADARSDLWSLGVVLYELLTGAEAFRAASVPEVCAAVLEREPEPIRNLRPEVPPELAAVVERCLAKDPDHRFADVAELAVALLPFGPARALVNAERASSLMRSQPRSGQGPASPRARASTPPSSRRVRAAARASPPRGVAAGPSSDAPLCRALPTVRVPRQRRSGSRAAVAVAVVIGGVLATLAYRSLPLSRRGAASAPAPVAVAMEEPSTPAVTSASTPIAVRAAPTPDRVVEAKPIATASMQRRAPGVARPSAPPRPRASTTGAASVAPTPKATTAESAPPARVAPSDPSGIELGY
jgi:serine/threonine-protein kinase